MTPSETTQTKACQSCVHWDAQAGSEKGLCRRNAPQSFVFEVDEETKFVTRFPETAADEWCGEYTGK